MLKERYYLKGNWQTEFTEVSKEAWIRAERAAGFRPKMDRNHPDYANTCATAGFGNGSIEGAIDYYDDLVHSGSTPGSQTDT